MKICSRCKLEKTLDDFYNTKRRPDGKHGQCITCMKACMKPKSKEAANRDSHKYAKNNPEKVKDRWRKYYNANKEKLAEKRKIRDSLPERKLVIVKYLERTKDKRNEVRRLRSKNKSPKQKIEKSLRDRFTKVINRLKKGTKFKSSIDLLGCSLEYFKFHIESQFKDGMDWNNHGNGADKWNIDHIKPLFSFNLHDLEQQKIAFHYTNLRPLWHIENLKRERKPFRSLTA